MKRLIVKKELIIAIILFGIFLILSGTAVILTNQFTIKSTTTELKTKIKSEESVAIIKRVMKEMNNPYLPDEYYGYFYKQDEYMVKDIKDEVKIYLAIMEIKNNDMNFNKHIVNKDKGTIEIPASEVNEQITRIFGPNITYKNVDLNGDECTYFTFKYSKKRKSYISKPLQCNKKTTKEIITYDDRKTTKDEMTFTQKLLIFDNNKLYLDFDLKTEIPEENRTNLDKYDAQMLRYTYTLTNNKDDNYYLTKIKLSK